MQLHKIELKTILYIQQYIECNIPKINRYDDVQYIYEIIE